MGEVYVYNTYPTMIGKAVEVPTPHGRLADCDAVKERIDEIADCDDKTYALCLLDWAVSKRTVIEAEG